MPPQPILVMGTRNRKKLGELLDLLAPHGIELRSLDDFPAAIEIDETGSTFAENAALKAVQQARQLGQWVLGEDSGLAVDFLNGSPGVYSARFSGENATDSSNNQLLLEKLAGVPLDRRSAYYVCHATLASPSGEIVAEAEDYCRGRILNEASGAGGFGYDPLFEVVECHRTFGELSPAVKSVLSHRSRAIRAMVPKIVAALRVG